MKRARELKEPSNLKEPSEDDRKILFIGVSSIYADGHFYCFETQWTPEFTPKMLAQLNGSKPLQRFDACVPGCNLDGTFQRDTWRLFKTQELPQYHEKHVTVVVGFMDG